MPERASLVLVVCVHLVEKKDGSTRHTSHRKRPKMRRMSPMNDYGVCYLRRTVAVSFVVDGVWIGIG